MIHVTPLKVSGSKAWCLLTADSEKELARIAERLGEDIHGKGQQPRHLDLNEHKRELALRYGAQETTQE